MSENFKLGLITKLAEGADKFSARETGLIAGDTLIPTSIENPEDAEELKKIEDQRLAKMARQHGGMAALLSLFKKQSKDDIFKGHIDTTLSRLDEAHKSLDDYGHYVSAYNSKINNQLDLVKNTPGGQILERLASKPGPNREAVIAALSNPEEAVRMGLSPDDLDTVRQHLVKVGATPDIANARRGMELSSVSYAASMNAMTNDMKNIASACKDDPQALSALNRAQTGIESSMRARIASSEMKPIQLEGPKSGGPLAALGEAFESFSKNMEEVMRNIMEMVGKIGATFFGQRQK